MHLEVVIIPQLTGLRFTPRGSLPAVHSPRFTPRSSLPAVHSPQFTPRSSLIDERVNDPQLSRHHPT
jgi:hypothetical protein